MSLSPGANYIIRSILPKALIPPLGIVAIREALQALEYEYLLPSLIQSKGGLAILSLVSALIVAIVKEKWKLIRNTRGARRMGATEFPKLVGRLPGNLDILLGLVDAWENDYPGQAFLPYIMTHGDTFDMRLLWDNWIFTANPAYIKTFLATDFGNYAKGETFQYGMKSVLGNGIFNVDGDMWKFHRGMTRPFFSRERVTDFDIFERHTKEALSKIKWRVSEDIPMDFQDLVSQFTLDSATEFLFGKSIGSLASPLLLPGQLTSSSSVNRFSQSFAAAQSLISFRVRVGPIWPLCEVFGDKSKKDMKVIDAFINPILDRALREEESRKAGSSEVRENLLKDDHPESREAEESQTLLGHLISVTDDKTLIHDELLNILLAGRDTTASGLTFTTYLLAENPKVLARLRQEVLDTVGRHERPTIEDVRDMKYLRAVLNETLRLFPAVPFNMKKSIDSTTWTDPRTGAQHYIPAGTTVQWSTLLMQRDPNLWGPDADVFDPDRWLDERNKQYYLSNPFIYTPFHAGPRICLGQQFALHEMSFFLIRLLQNFDHIEFAPDAQPAWSQPPESWKTGGGRKAIEKIWAGAHLTIYSKGGLWVRMRAASD